MAPVFAYVEVRDAAAFELIGLHPMALWPLVAALSARGVDRAVLAVSAALLAEAPEYEGVELVTLPAAGGLPTVLASAGVIAHLHAGSVFLTSGSIERALSEVLDRGARSTTTVLRRAHQASRLAAPRVKTHPTDFEVFGAYIFSEPLKSTDERGSRATVAISEIEAIDALTPEGAVVARALVETGQR